MPPPSRLEAAGVRVRFADSVEGARREGIPFRPRVSIRMPGDFAGGEVVYSPENTRRVNIFPEIAAQKHAVAPKDLTAFVASLGRRRPCMMTFNAGDRRAEGARIGGLGIGRGIMRGALTMLFRLPAFRKYFTAVFIGEELGTPLNSFRLWRRRLHQPGGLGLKIIADKTPAGGKGWRVVKDWNCQTPNKAEAFAERKRRARELGEYKRENARRKGDETRELRRIPLGRLARPLLAQAVAQRDHEAFNPRLRAACGRRGPAV